MILSDDACADIALPVLSAKRLGLPLKFPLVAHCDQHELLAVVLTSWDIQVFRLVTEQLAFSIKREGENTVSALHWTTDGRNLYVAWSNGTYALHSGENGKSLNTSTIRSNLKEDDWSLDVWAKTGADGDDDDEGPTICCFGLATDRVTETADNVGAASQKQQDSRMNTDDWALGAIEGVEADELEGFASLGSASSARSPPDISVVDLPMAISTLDVTRILPRMTAIHGASSKSDPTGNRFSSQSATDSTFDAEKTMTPGRVQSLLLCQDDGTVQVFLDDTVKIGACSISGRPLLHSTLSGVSRHAILVEKADASLHLAYIEMPLAFLSSPLLHVIATNTKRIQNHLDYVICAIKGLDHQYRGGVHFPSRMINSLAQTLEGHQEGDAVLNLYHLAMTGNFKPPVLEWITDVLKDTNHKRWDQAITNMYGNVQQHLFFHLIPALDRFSIAVVTLQSHAKFHEGGGMFECPPEPFATVLDNINSLGLVAQRMLLIVVDELRQFQAFSKWLRLQVELGVAEPLSASALEIETREVPSLDYTKILTYINQTMKHSKLEKHILSMPPLVAGSLTRQAFLTHRVVQHISFDKTAHAIGRLQDHEGRHEASLQDTLSILVMNLPTIAATLKGHTRIVLEHITEWQSKMLPPPIHSALNLDASTTKVLDMTMTSIPGADIARFSLRTLLLALNSTTTSELLLIASEPPQAIIPSPPLPRDPSPVQISITFPSTIKVIYAQFLPFNMPELDPLLPRQSRSPQPRSSAILILARNSSTNEPTTFLSYHPVPLSSILSSPPLLPTPQILHIFPNPSLQTQPGAANPNSSSPHFRPSTFLLASRAGQNRICIVFDARGREWQVLDLDAASRVTPCQLDAEGRYCTEEG